MRTHFPPMHAMAVEQFWIPTQLCELQGDCSTEPGHMLQLVTLQHQPLAQCNDGTAAVYYRLELETKVKQRFAKISITELVSIMSYRRPSLIKIGSVSQFHVYLHTVWSMSIKHSVLIVS